MPTGGTSAEGHVDRARRHHDEDLSPEQKRITRVRDRSDDRIEELRAKLKEKIETEKLERAEKIEAIKQRAAERAEGGVSEEAAELIASLEGWRSDAYQDIAGVWTIGYGHTGADVGPGMSISKSEGLRLLAEDAQIAADAVDDLVTARLNEHQRAALISFTLNCGNSALADSTLLKRVNAGASDAEIRDAFLMWTKAEVNGTLTVVQGLVNRREAEAALFNS